MSRPVADDPSGRREVDPGGTQGDDMRNVGLGVLIAGVTVTFLIQTAASQSRVPPREATDVTRAEIEAVLKHPEGGGDRQIKVVDMGKYNVGVGVLHRNAIKPNPTGVVTGIAHTEVTEVYYITSGSGTLVTGGTILNAKPLAADAEVVKVAVGPSVNGTFQGGQRRKVSVGDVVIIPPGVLHGWSEVEDHVTYVSVRPDADHVLPAGYLHPALSKK
jgi:mannose-6-phosphate isomerase-like protein (cupin superfamily)